MLDKHDLPQVLSDTATGVKIAAGLLFRGQVQERSTGGIRQVHGLWYPRPPFW